MTDKTAAAAADIVVVIIEGTWQGGSRGIP